mgnify:CR=1 FL=1
MNGCFYDDEDIKLLEEMKANCIKALMKGAIYTDEKAERKARAIENILNRLKELEEKKTCLHCGSKEAAYCEECYQELIATNAKLQKENRELEEIKNSKLDEYLHNNLWICKDLAENYIPKSKIKEKIEELNKKYKEIESNYTEEELDNGDEGWDDYIEMQKIQMADNILYELMGDK